jgi:hypothetical protein
MKLHATYTENSESTFLFTWCQDGIPPHGYDFSTTKLVHGANIVNELRNHGYIDDKESVFNLGLGESCSLGFSQGSYDGIVITKIR